MAAEIKDMLVSCCFFKHAHIRNTSSPIIPSDELVKVRPRLLKETLRTETSRRRDRRQVKLQDSQTESANQQPETSSSGNRGLPGFSSSLQKNVIM